MDDTSHESPIAQAGTIPFRIVNGTIEFCVITSSSGKRWGFPKGIIDPGETPQETALKETFEEAGLTGVLQHDPIGEYSYEKWNTTLTVTVFLMRVTEIEDDWLEAGIRTRRWVTRDEGLALIDREPLRDLLAQASPQLS